MQRYFCCDERRRAAVLAHGTLNGIDFLEVEDDITLPPEQRQRTLFVHLLRDLEPPGPNALTTENVRIEGGERIPQIDISSTTPGTGDEAKILTVTVEEAGDFSPYVFRLVNPANEALPPDGFDPILSQITFSFKAGCPSDLDCAPQSDCPPSTASAIEINYLAKDYASFRQVMFDRLATLMPDWKERHAADMGVALVEVMSYVGDYLSYRQDAIGTEAYLGTARRRVSVRRHSRLVDYFMNDGSNARAWIQIQVNADLTLPKSTKLFTRVTELPHLLPDDSKEQEKALASGAEVFETMRETRLFAAHNTLTFHTWGDQECCLPKGATRATLRGRLDDLQPGDVLIFEEVKGPQTGASADADPARRHAVRLTEVAYAEDPVGGLFYYPYAPTAIAVTEIAWHPQDALPFPLCISALNGAELYEDVSIARGNIVLADHGRTVETEPLPPVPEAALTWVDSNMDRCDPSPTEQLPARFRPTLSQQPLTQAAPYPYPDSRPIDAKEPDDSAQAAMAWEMRETLPSVWLKTDPNSTIFDWNPQRDLLNSEVNSAEFVAEMEDDGTAALRFGDNRNGMRPPAGTSFLARYRVGNGKRGNVGAEAIFHIASNDAAILGIRNPLSAQGGRELESIEEVRRSAPAAFRTQERAVTPEDYARMTERHPEVQRAAATLRWTGSWRTVFITVDRFGGEPVDSDFETDLRRFLERFRMAGHDLEIDSPRFVSLEIELRVCVLPDYLAAHVKSALLLLFSRNVLPNGERGLFHPDNFTFGQPVYLSRLIAAAQAVPGVQSVEVITFQRQGVPDPTQAALKASRLEIGRLEIARLDNDPNYAEHGLFRLEVKGGR